MILDGRFKGISVGAEGVIRFRRSEVDAALTPVEAV